MRFEYLPKGLKSISMLILLLHFGITYGVAQTFAKEYKRGIYDGFVRLKDGTLIKGKIKARGKAANMRNAYLIDKNGQAHKYKHKNVFDYGFAYESDSVYFENMSDMGLLQVIEKGCVSLYLKTYWTITISGSLILRPTVRTDMIYQYKGGRLHVEQPFNFKRAWSNMLRDNPSISTKIANREEGYRSKNYFEIAKEYNQTCTME